MKEKLRNKGFWISLVSAVIVFVQSIGIKVDVPAVNEIISALLTVLVVLGIISNPSSGSGYADSGASPAEGDAVTDDAQEGQADESANEKRDNKQERHSAAQT